MNARRILVVASIGLAGFALGRTGMNGPTGRALARAQEPPAFEMNDEMRAMVEAATPGTRHRVLDRLVGSWTAELALRAAPDAAPLAFRGTVRRGWVLDGRFIEERFDAESPLGPLRGISYMGYNNLDQQYESVWLETGSTAMSFEKGTLHGDEMVLHMRSERRDPATGRVVYSWGKLDMSDPDRHVYVFNTTSPDGTTYRALEGVMTRVAGALRE